MSEKTINAFYGLLRAGLWGKEDQSITLEGVNYEDVYQLAEDQSVIGLLLGGLEYISSKRPPQELLLQWIGEVQVLEQQNKAMNSFIGVLVEKMREEGIIRKHHGVTKRQNRSCS